MTRKALGKGLEALLGGLPIEDSGRAERLIEIDVHRILPNRYQPRQTFDDTGLQELAASIKAQGILQPVSVRRGEDGRYELIAGERRWRAAQLAGLRRIPALVRETTDRDLVELALVENLQRKDLNPMESAQAYQRLMKEFHLSQEEISKRVGKERSSVANHLRLLNLPGPIQEALRQERLTMGHAKAILSLSEAKAQWTLAQRILDGGLSVREAERRAQQIKGVAVKTHRKSREIAAQEERLKHYLGTNIRIVPGAKGGRIVIDYYSAEDLERILEMIIQ
ncbi:MAG TPA: ParB/RepB/Spo0J family partition protein [Nitrospiria bacterium]|jgi:ParB family chromosome partitioning protein|nr:ParB/RepB/Spo0J family partition protein [Nitrospiria bacterium]